MSVRGEYDEHGYSIFVNGVAVVTFQSDEEMDVEGMRSACLHEGYEVATEEDMFYSGQHYTGDEE